MEAIGEKVNEAETEYFLSAVNYRSQLDPPMPSTYFGNSIIPSIVRSRNGEIVGPDGLCNAAVLIGEAIHKWVTDRETVLKGTWLDEVEAVKQRRFLGANGSPIYDLYATDFGWGKVEKCEAPSIDIDGGIPIEKSRKFEGGLEVSLSLPRERMDAFATLSNTSLKVSLLQPKI